ncbi:MAG: hypothetical protein JWQ02_3827, partial [Capsulimonas sp.]|nr:hypothetical protein [Capsulimonas sp.]
MDDFLIGVLAGVLLGMLLRGSRRVSDEILTAVHEPV